MQENSNKSSYGRTLRSAREALDLSIESVASTLHLESAVVEGIEQEDKEKLPVAAFVRGYVRSYSLLVGCDADEVVAQFNRSAGEAEYMLPNVASLKSQKRSNDPLFIGISIIVVGALLGLLLVWGYDLIAEFGATSPSNDIVATQEQYSAPTPTVALPMQEDTFSIEADDELAAVDMADALLNAQASDNIEEANVEQVDSADSVMPAEDGLAVNEASPAEDVPDASSNFLAEVVEQNTVPVIQKLTPLAPTGTDRIVLTFRDESWVEVTDANGYKLIFGLYDENVAPVSLQGQAPFKLMLGKANSVDVSINESLFNVRPYIRSNNTARFLVESPGTAANN